MNPQEEFEKTRWKLADQMDDHDIEILLANKEKLNEEERAAFAHLITEDEPFSDNPLDDAINKSIDAPENQTDDEIPTPPVVEPVIPIIPAPSIPENVVTQDKLDTYIEGKRKEWEAAGKTKAEQDKEETKIQRLFEEGYEPKDWNEYSMQFLEKMTPIIEKRMFDRLEKERQAQVDLQNQTRTEQQKVYQQFEGEFANLSKQKLIPDPTTQPDEYKRVHEEIIKVGDAHGKSNITDAYKLWAILPKQHGGGLDYTPPAVDPNKRIQAQKQAAGRVGSSKGAVIPARKANDYNTIHNARMEDLIDNRLAQS